MKLLFFLLLLSCSQTQKKPSLDQTMKKSLIPDHFEKTESVAPVEKKIVLQKSKKKKNYLMSCTSQLQSSKDFSICLNKQTNKLLVNLQIFCQTDESFGGQSLLKEKLISWKFGDLKGRTKTDINGFVNIQIPYQSEESVADFFLSSRSFQRMIPVDRSPASLTLEKNECK